MGRRLRQQNVDKLGYLVDIATESDLINRVVPGDRLTGVSCFLRRLAVRWQEERRERSCRRTEGGKLCPGLDLFS